MGEWYNPRTNPKSTSSFNSTGYTNTSEPGISRVTAMLNTGTTAQSGLEIRYKQKETSYIVRENWVNSKALEIENSMYTSISTKLFAVKMQRATSIVNHMSIGGVPTAADIEPPSLPTADTAETSMAPDTSARHAPLSSGPSGYGGY